MKLKGTFMSTPICVKILKYQCIPEHFTLICLQFFQFITLKQTIFSANYSLQTNFFTKKIPPPNKYNGPSLNRLAISQSGQAAGADPSPPPCVTSLFEGQ